MSKTPEKKKPVVKKHKVPLQTSPPALYTVRTKKTKKPKLEYLAQLKNLSATEWNLICEDQVTMPFLDSMKLRQVEARPFLKWVGGKNSLLPQLEKFIPPHVDRYIEPFLGGGAMFFFLKRKFPKMRAFLRDSNKELINCYRVVRDRPVELMRWLDHHSAQFKKHGSAYFYSVRSEHNLTNDMARAARTIFLNKACFNGLWRVNAREEFNTPVGSNKNPRLYDSENLLACSLALRDAQLEANDFRILSREAHRGDLIYLDPPYVPISANSDFKRYTADQFRDAEQAELAQIFRELDTKGCHLILSNSEHPLSRELYEGYTLQVVSAPRFINCKPGGRGNISELVITNTRRPKQPQSLFVAPAEPLFPETKYMGSKQRLLPFILKHMTSIRCESVLDAFSGSACVAYALKQTGVRVYANDFLKFSYYTAKATVENNATILCEEDIGKLMHPNPSAPTFIRDTFRDLYFDHSDCEFLDHLWANLQELDSPLKASIGFAAASRACMKKRPRGLFTFTGQKGWDDRVDLKLSMHEQFLIAVNAFNNSIFSNGHQNRAFNQDVFELPPDLADVVYIDTPYVSPFSDCDYTRRYHFVEGFCRYWQGCEIMPKTTTKKIRSYPTAFATKAGANEAFARLFHHFRDSKLVVSYSSNCIPNKKEMIDLLKQEKKHIEVYETPHRYHSGNQAHKVGDNNSAVTEYLFIAT
jgi:DNA adenine methylase